MSKYQNAIIYFMSGTGNTYRVATWVAEEFESQNTKTQIIPFEKASPTKEFIPGDKTLLGLFLPTHGFTAPWVMIRFALNLPAGEGTHAFISSTRGGTKFGNMYMPGFEGTAAYLLALILKLKGYKIRGAIGVDMPLNWTALVPGFSSETAENMNIRQKPKVIDFVKGILNGEKKFGVWTFVSLFLGILILPFSLGYLLIARYILSKMFFATSECNSCGICANNCPANAIQMRGDDKPLPFWTFKCESCMRCMNYCPNQAIESSHLLAIGYYYIASIPVGFFLMKWLLESLPILQQINNGLINTLLQYGYMLLAFVFTYYIFHHLIKIKFFNKIFTYGTLTHYYRRYRQPGVKLKDLK
jgi:Pyruvate/2-oxoacid:ferredoxin oxidoreductase delta subunit